jgi:hypothetical protein
LILVILNLPKTRKNIESNVQSICLGSNSVLGGLSLNLI